MTIRFWRFYSIFLLGLGLSCARYADQESADQESFEGGSDNYEDSESPSDSSVATDPPRDTGDGSDSAGDVDSETTASDAGELDTATAGHGSDTVDAGDTEDTAGETGEDSETEPQELACNGNPNLCDRRFDEVLFPMTHNSFSAAAYGFMFVANHDTGLAAQLEGGVRGLMLDIYEDSGELRLCHGPCVLGMIPHSQAIGIIAQFLAKNPSDIITIVYQDSDNVDKTLLERELGDAGLLDLLYEHQSGGPWLTLREMIESNTRLFITTERQGGPQPWLHYAYELMWDTKYTHKSTDDFDCEVLRGDGENDLFLINHWVNSNLDLPSKSAATKSNSEAMLLSRLERCHLEAGQRPNFIAVDFWEQGDLVQAVDTWNRQ